MVYLDWVRNHNITTIRILTGNVKIIILEHNRIIKRLGCAAFFDDMPDFLVHADKSVAAFLVRNEDNFDFAEKKYLLTHYNVIVKH
jgi:hypothetical protein